MLVAGALGEKNTCICMYIYPFVFYDESISRQLI